MTRIRQHYQFEKGHEMESPNALDQTPLKKHSAPADGTICDCCSKPATKILSSKTCQYAADWFIGYYCQTCYDGVADAMKTDRQQTPSASDADSAASNVKEQNECTNGKWPTGKSV